MKSKSTKLLLSMMLTSVVLTGCESLDTEDQDVNADVAAEETNQGAANSDADNDVEAGKAPNEAQINAEKLAEQKAREAAEREQAALRETRTFYFDFDQSKIQAESKPALAAHAAFLSANPSIKVVVEGHCDERGTKGYNIALGERRGNAVAKFLLVNGVSSSQIEVVSYGEEKPVNNGHDEAAWAQNRRAYIAY